MSRRKDSTELSVSEAAKQFGYTRTWVQKLLIKGELPGEKNRFGHWRVSVKAMQELARKRQEREGGPERAA